MRGVYHEILPPERSVHMESFDDYPGSRVTAGLLKKTARPRSLPPCSTHRRKFATSSFKLAWNTAPRRATTNLRSCSLRSSDTAEAYRASLG